MQDLISRGFMMKLSDMDKAKQEVVANAGFQHYFPWRVVYKEDSVSTPVRIVVDPSASGLNQTLAKGENMLTRRFPRCSLPSARTDTLGARTSRRCTTC
jgi:hypothetical protein